MLEQPLVAKILPQQDIVKVMGGNKVRLTLFTVWYIDTNFLILEATKY